MRALISALLLGMMVITVGCARPQTEAGMAAVQDSRWLIVPGKRIGEITAKTGEADLVRLYGKEQVTPSDVYVGEGFSEPGTLVFPDQPEKRLEILWADPARREKPEVILIRGTESVWHTEEGITLGTPVSKLELANEGPFSLYGFGWDYGGTITGWQDGRLTLALRTEGGVVMLRLSEGAALNKATDDELMSIAGDREITSDHPVVRQIDPAVSEIAVRFFHPDPSDPNYD